MKNKLIKVLDDIKAHKADAFEQLLNLVQNTVLSFGLKVCGEVEDAKDTMQETLLKAFKSLPDLEFKDPKALNVWLYKVAKNACLMMRRKSKFESKQKLSLDQFMPGGHHGQKPIEVPDWSDTPEDAFLKGELREVVQKAIFRLPTPYRLVLVLRDMEQLSTKEVAEVLELSEKNVKIRLHRARLFLRKELEKYFLSKAVVDKAESKKTRKRRKKRNDL
jgi:RNA polymerase sigma-70 factor (ECF subfamily)